MACGPQRQGRALHRPGFGSPGPDAHFGPVLSASRHSRLPADQQFADFLNADLLIFNLGHLCIFIVEIRCRVQDFFSYIFNQRGND